MKKLLFILSLIIIYPVHSQVYMRVAGAKMNVDNASLNLQGHLNINSGTFIQKNSSTFSLDGDWTNSATFIPNNGLVVFDGANSQSINTANLETFYDLNIEKSSGTITLPSSRTITITNELSFNSTTVTPIYARSGGLVKALSVVRPGFGHVDGPLQMLFGTGNLANTIFPVGNGDDYTPIEIDLNGSAGTAGYLQAESNDLSIAMLGSQLDADQNVEREYTLSAGGGSSFDVGASRSFSMVIHYLNPDDIRGGANSNTFETARYADPLWADELLTSGVRTANSVESFTSILGTYVVGPEDFFLELYSRASGSFSDASNWSMYGYGSPNASPFAPRSRDLVFIGDGDSITLTANQSILASRTLLVETAGPSGNSGAFMTDDYVLDGSGTFSLTSGGRLGIGDVAGIVNSPTASGSIQTADRNYNLGNHNLGTYIYTSASSGTIGNGLPSDMKDLTIVAGSDILMTKSVNISNDLSIITGNLDADSYTLQGTGSGTFTVLDDAQFTIGDINNMLISVPFFGQYDIGVNSIVEFDGGVQLLSDVPVNFNTVLGFGYVYTSNSGTKYVNSDLIVRSDLVINTGSYLEVQLTKTLDVNGSIFNFNSGLMQYGNLNLGK